MSSTPGTTAQNSTLFEIDAELEVAFDVASQEQEQTGTISDEAKQRWIDLFAAAAVLQIERQGQLQYLAFEME